jgi:hypothetical protein
MEGYISQVEQMMMMVKVERLGRKKRSDRKSIF